MPTKKGHKFIVHALFEKSMKDYMNTLVYMHTFEEISVLLCFSELLEHGQNFSSTFSKLLSINACINLHNFASKLMQMPKFRHIQDTNYTTGA